MVVLDLDTTAAATDTTVAAHTASAAAGVAHHRVVEMRRRLRRHGETRAIGQVEDNGANGRADRADLAGGVVLAQVVHHRLAAVHLVEQHVGVRALATRQLIGGRAARDAHERAQYEAHLLVDVVADLLGGVDELLVERDAPCLEYHGLLLGRAQRDLDAEGQRGAARLQQRLHVAQRALRD